MPQPAVQCLKRSLLNNALGNSSKGADLKVQITSGDPVTQLVCPEPRAQGSKEALPTQRSPCRTPGDRSWTAVSDMLDLNQVPWEPGCHLSL